MEAFIAMLGLSVLAAFIGLIVMMIMAEWKIYKKLGEEGWVCLIPIYSTYVLYKRIWSEGAARISVVAGLLSVAMSVVDIVVEQYVNEVSMAGAYAYLVLSVLAIIGGIVSVVLSAIACNKLAEAFGRGVGTTIGLICLYVVFIPILGFGKAQYKMADSMKAAQPALEAGNAEEDGWLES